jgi:hypothetical protein
MMKKMYKRNKGFKTKNNILTDKKKLKEKK